MEQGYFHRVHRLSPTRFWVNNPTPSEADLAIAAGAISCTTNPTFAMRLLQHEETAADAQALVDRALANARQDGSVCESVVTGLCAGLFDRFLPQFEASGGTRGFVSIQGNPHLDEDAGQIVDEALRYRGSAVNFIAKVPATQAGIAAMEELLKQGVPVVATEIMGVAQMIACAEAYRRSVPGGSPGPAFFLTHITGILDEYFQKVVREKEIAISRDVLWQAGCAVARRQYRVFKERGYDGIMLGGGARGTHHFTEMVGSEMHVTINWTGTADRLIQEDPPVIWRMFTPTPDAVLSELLEKVPGFRQAYDEAGLAVEEFARFGPVLHFRDLFVRGWDHLLGVIAARRPIAPAPGKR